MRLGLPNGEYDGDPFSVQLSLKRPMPSDLTCHYCDEPATTRDHVVAKTRMGSDQWWNLVPCCQRCNEKESRQHPTCSCTFCKRAQRLFYDGWKRNRPRALSRTEFRMLRDAKLNYPPDGQELPPSFRGST